MVYVGGAVGTVVAKDRVALEGQFRSVVWCAIGFLRWVKLMRTRNTIILVHSKLGVLVRVLGNPEVGLGNYLIEGV